MTRGTQALLWGGPEDGATLYVPPGDLPSRLGAHRTLDGALVAIRGRALHADLTHVAVYEHVTMPLLLAWRARVGAQGRLFDAADHQHLADVPVYVHTDLVTRWTTHGQV